MISVFQKEIKVLLSSIIGYVVIGVFLTITGLFLFVFRDTSLLDSNFASLVPFFDLAPFVFLFLIPALTMRSFSEEFQLGTIELLSTKPLSLKDIIIAKYLANLLIVVIALLPTLLYYYTVNNLGLPKGNLDSGSIIGSYFGLLLLASSFIAMGIFASTLVGNQVVGFLLGAFICFLLYWGMDYISFLPGLEGRWDLLVQKIGINYHYTSISRGVIDTRDLIYFLSVIAIFLVAAFYSLIKKRG